MAWHLLDTAFFVFHSALVVFNLLGWLVPRLRPWNLLALLLTGGSWTLLGLFCGFGYCPLTDWHWQVLDHLGKGTPHTSYIQYLLERTLNIRVTAGTADRLTLTAYLVSLGCSGYVNFRAWKRKR